MTVDPNWYLAPIAFFALGALLALVDRKAPCLPSHLAALAGSAVGVAVSLGFLVSGPAQRGASLSVSPLASFNVSLDPLSAYFALVIYVVAVPASLYALGYLGGHRDSTAGLAIALNGFLAGMVLVVLADSVFAFLFAWEVMSLTSFFLVIYNSRQPEVRRAGFVYLVMTHVSTAFLVVSFFLLYAHSGGLEFDAIRRAATSLPPIYRDAVFALSLVTFATKAGVIPLHVWLPLAHPAAPSHVSALMSGVMLKVAIYGLLRVGWDLAGPGPAWWGGLVLTLGAISAVLGVLYALMEHDLKRLLAYHSVENVGIILMGLGAAFLLMSLGQTTAAALGLLAGLYHVLNHAVFKSLLFLGAGAVQEVTHSRDLEALGGLIRRMPWTAGAFLVGAAAISALPPLNGFASEWLTFQSLLSLGAVGSPFLGIGAAAAAGLLALTGGLAAFCFVKAFGIAFLGVPRGPAAAVASEAKRSMLLGMGVLALLCFALGLFPLAVGGVLAPVTQQLAGAPARISLGLVLPEPSQGGSLVPLAVLGVLALAGALALALARAIGGPGRSRVAPPWVCGVALEPSMQYSAAALAKPVRIIFRALVRPYREVEREYAHGGYFVSSVRYEAGLHPIYERHLYRPAVRLLLTSAERIRALQNGSLRTYLAYMFVTLVAVLALTR